MMLGLNWLKNYFLCKSKNGEVSAGYSSLWQAREARVCEGGSSASTDIANDSESDTADVLFTNVLAPELVTVDCFDE